MALVLANYEGVGQGEGEADRRVSIGAVLKLERGEMVPPLVPLAVKLKGRPTGKPLGARMP